MMCGISSSWRCQGWNTVVLWFASTKLRRHDTATVVIRLADSNLDWYEMEIVPLMHARTRNGRLMITWMVEYHALPYYYLYDRT